MRGYVVDASVAVKWLVTEPLSDEAASLLDSGVTLLAPDLMFAEAASALSAKCGRGEIDREELAEIVNLMRAAPVAVPLSTRQLAASSTRLAADLGHPVYDCFYLALAIDEGYPVVTADTRFYRKVRKHPYLGDRMVHVADIAFS
ncbi:MAG: type II toxin-antitoxin system VapC family toxin [Gammaproteobacteria bacterium]|nr:type II toxin-antitoxin system VapC family toxin [Gammaproteobacteria bacterium]